MIKKETIVGLVLVIGSIILLVCALNVIRVAVPLYVLKDNIEFGEETKNNELIQESMIIRDKEFYNSSDNFVRLFSRSNYYVKGIVSIFAVFTVIVIFFNWIYLIGSNISDNRKNKKKRKEIMERIRKVK